MTAIAMRTCLPRGRRPRRRKRRLKRVNSYHVSTNVFIDHLIRPYAADFDSGVIAPLSKAFTTSTKDKATT